jgi:hypothetical protein
VLAVGAAAKREDCITDGEAGVSRNDGVGAEGCVMVNYVSSVFFGASETYIRSDTI